MERGVLSGNLRHGRQGGDGHGAEAIATRSSMSESAIRCVIIGNMEASHRRVASPVTNMEASHRRVTAPVANMEASHRRIAAPVANMWQRGCHGGALMVKEHEVRLSVKPVATAAIGVTRWHWRPSPCCTDDIDDHGLQEKNKLTRLGR
uniref:Uncharacterized protein n=1 Tax=Triticum urartu TaxID=4572 RepID=A0A8R7RD25_TRIUA